MKLSVLLDNIKSIKIRKAPRKDEWEVFDLRYGDKGRLIASFQSKDEADKFVDRRITKE